MPESEFLLDEQNRQLLADEVAKWKKLLNLTVAPLLFATTATFIPLIARSPLFGLILVLFAILFMYLVGEEFPTSVKDLREKKDKTFREVINLKRIQWYYFLRPSAMVGLTLYMLSWIFMTLASFGIFTKFLH